jgi:group I intron endonuclease
MIVYKTTNIVNQKCYIGATSKKLNQRKIHHIHYAFKRNSNINFHKALREFGKESFKWEILIYCEKQWVEYYETECIKLYNAYTDGYNMRKTNIGKNCGYKHTQKTKDKIKKNHSNFWNGRKHTNESIKKMSQCKMGKYKGKDNLIYIDIDKKQLFILKQMGYTIKEIAKIFEVSKSTIKNRLKEWKYNG